MNRLTERVDELHTQLARWQITCAPLPIEFHARVPFNLHSHFRTLPLPLTSCVLLVVLTTLALAGAAHALIAYAAILAKAAAVGSIAVATASAAAYAAT